MGTASIVTEEERKTRLLLMKLGITANYIGHDQCIYAISTAVLHPEKLCAVCKDLYPNVAKHFNTTWKCVERNIRTVAEKAWENNPKLISKLAGYQLRNKPKATQFLAIFTFYLLGEASDT